MKKRTISTRTCTGITTLQALKQMEKAAFVFRKEVSKILKDNDLFYCTGTDIKNHVSNNNRCVDAMLFSLIRKKSIAHDMIMCKLKTRKEALEFAYDIRV